MKAWKNMDSHGVYIKYQVDDKLYFVGELKPAIRDGEAVCCYAEAGIELTYDEVRRLNDLSSAKDKQEMMVNELLYQKFDEIYNRHDKSMMIFHYFKDFSEGFDAVNYIMKKGCVDSEEKYNMNKKAFKWKRPFNFANDFIKKETSESYYVLSAAKNENDDDKIDIFISKVSYDDFSESEMRNVREGYSISAQVTDIMHKKIDSQDSSVYTRSFDSVKEYENYMSRLMSFDEVPDYSESRSFKKISSIENDGIKNAQYYARYAR